MNEALLSAESISLKPMLAGISLSLNSGEIVTIIGPNGAGKTTLLELLLGLKKPDSGQITRHKNLKIGYVPQRWEINQYVPITVAEFLRLGAEKAIEPQIIDDTGIAALLSRQLKELSGGERQRVLLARAVSRQPNLLVLDEPVQGIDIDGQTHMYEYLEKIRSNSNCCILLVSHDLNFVMAATNRVICINRHICCEGRPDQVSQHDAFRDMFGTHAHKWIAHYSHHHDHQHGWECKHD